jgi:hypothetical protein
MRGDRCAFIRGQHLANARHGSSEARDDAAGETVAHGEPRLIRGWQQGVWI